MNPSTVAHEIDPGIKLAYEQSLVEAIHAEEVRSSTGAFKNLLHEERSLLV